MLDNMIYCIYEDPINNFLSSSGKLSFHHKNPASH